MSSKYFSFFLYLGIIIVSNSHASDLNYFPSDYTSAVQKFKDNIAELKGINSQVISGSIAIPSNIDSDLEIQYLNIPAKRPNADLIVLTSGIHGAEAYAGSAIQQMFLKEILPLADLDKIGFLIIHSINPFGFKHFRRVDEYNIDLNRNFPANDNLYSMDNQGYDALASLLEPQTPVSCRHMNVSLKTLICFWDLP